MQKVTVFFSAFVTGLLLLVLSPMAHAEAGASTIQSEDQIYDVNGDPDAELKRAQQQNAALDLEKEDPISENGKSVSGDINVDDNSSYRRYFQKGLEMQLGYSFFTPQSSGAGGSTGDAAVAFTTNGSPSFGARYSSIRNDGFGYTMGLRLEPFYGINNLTVGGVSNATVNSGTTTIPSTGNFVLVVPELNATFELEGAYIIMGGNYALPFGSVGTSSMTGGFGGQVGVGWFIGSSLTNLDFGTNALSLEILFQAYQVGFSGLGNSGGASGSSQPISMGGGIVRFGMNFR